MRFGGIVDPLPIAAAQLIIESDTDSKVAFLEEPSSLMYVASWEVRGRIYPTRIENHLGFLASSTQIAEGTCYIASNYEQPLGLIYLSHYCLSLWLWSPELSSAV